MGAKVDSALRALDEGVQAVVIASGKRPGVICDIMGAKSVGTFFVASSAGSAADAGSSEGPAVETAALAARSASRDLQALSTEERREILDSVAEALRAHSTEIIAANEADIVAAQSNKVAEALVQRLKLTPAKIEQLAVGLGKLSAIPEPIGRILRRTEISEGLELTQMSVPIGVLLIVFESRPDSLPQIASLALKSGNGLLLKGGKEAERSNKAIHHVIVEAIHKASKGRVPREIIGLVTGRDQVDSLLKLDGSIDLVIPRGGKALVEHVKRNTRIPVLGHADGVCHVYVDAAADAKKVKLN